MDLISGFRCSEVGGFIRSLGFGGLEGFRVLGFRAFSGLGFRHQKLLVWVLLSQDLGFRHQKVRVTSVLPYIGYGLYY